MSCFKWLRRLVGVILGIALLSLSVAAQTFQSTVVQIERDKIIVNKISDPSIEIVDLGEQIRTRCANSYRVEAYGISGEIRFDSLGEADKESLGRLLLDLSATIRRLLSPLEVRPIVLLVCKFEQVPKNYRFVQPGVDAAFPVVLLYQDPRGLDLGCKTYSTFCEELYATTPHEITHLSLGKLVGGRESQVARWFDEGMANYVEQEVSRVLAPVVFERKLWNTFPRVSLNRSSVRSQIWKWKPVNTVDSVGSLSTWEKKWNEMSLYGASAEVFRLVINRANGQGYENPLKLILKNVYKMAGKRSLDSEDIISIVNTTLKTDIRNLGLLTSEEKKELIKTAIEILSHPSDESSETRDRTFYALSILACLDGEVSAETIELLVSIVNNTQQPDIFRGLAATALQQRVRSGHQQEAHKFDSEFKTKLRNLTFRSALE
ncbi:MAG: hypothetical protein ACK4S4_07255 [Pyrinomonadaceae bacterium]